MNISTLVSRIVRPPLQIGGLEFSDRILRYIFVNHSLRIVKIAQLAIPSGIIESGRVLDETKLTQALTVLKHQAGLAGKAVYIVGVLGPAQLYTQMLAFPALSHEELGEAVLWNAQMLLPFKPEDIYFDWEERPRHDVKGSLDAARASPVVNANAEKGDDRDRNAQGDDRRAGKSSAEDSGINEAVLLLLAERKLIDPYIRALKSAGFLTIALESPSRAIARLLDKIPDAAKGVAIVSRFLEEGVLLTIIADGLPWFDYWRGWDSEERALFAQGGDAAAISALLREEFRRIAQFARSKFPGEGFSFVVVRSGDDPASKNLEDMVYGLVEKEFSELETKRLTIPGVYPAWAVSFGAGLRSLIARSRDKQVSLSPPGTEEIWRMMRIEDFLSLWVRVTVTALAALFAFTLGVDIILARLEYYSQPSFTFTIERASIQDEIKDLQEKAKLFNAQVVLVSEVMSSRVPWGKIFETIRESAADVEIRRLRAERGDKKLAIEAVAPTAQTAIRFRESLAQSPLFSNVDLPLSTLTTATPFSFRLVVTVK